MRFSRFSVRPLYILAPLTTLLVIAGVWLVIPRPITGFSYAKAQRWSIAPVRVMRLEPKWLRRFEPLPKPFTPHEYAVLRACWVPPLGTPIHPAGYDRFYRGLVARFPHDFYPEQCLAEWYLEQHNQSQYQYWQQRALHDAPAVIAGSVLFDNGKPAANARFQIIFQVYDAARPNSGHAVILYPEATTDSEGCYYLPVYKGVYACEGPSVYTDSVFIGRNRNLNLFVPFPSVGDMNTLPNQSLPAGAIATSHVGVLPTFYAREKIQFVSPLQPANNDTKHPVSLAGQALNFVWKPVPGAVRYTVQVSVRSAGPISDEMNGTMIAPDGLDYAPSTTQPKCQISLARASFIAGGPPVLNRNTVYELSVFAHSSQNPQSLNDIIDVADEYDFIPKDAP